MEKIFDMDILAFNKTSVCASSSTNITEIMPERLQKCPKKYKRKKQIKQTLKKHKPRKKKTKKKLPLTHFSSKESHLESFFKK